MNLKRKEEKCIISHGPTQNLQRTSDTKAGLNLSKWFVLAWRKRPNSNLPMWKKCLFIPEGRLEWICNFVQNSLIVLHCLPSSK